VKKVCLMSVLRFEAGVPPTEPRCSLAWNYSLGWRNEISCWYHVYILIFTWMSVINCGEIFVAVGACVVGGFSFAQWKSELVPWLTRFLHHTPLPPQCCWNPQLLLILLIYEYHGHFLPFVSLNWPREEVPSKFYYAPQKKKRAGVAQWAQWSIRVLEMPWLRMLVMGSPLSQPGFDVNHVGFVVDEVDLIHVLFRILRFPLPILIPLTAPHSSSIIRGRYSRAHSDRRAKWTQCHPIKLKK
jgi:hypothetical protein